MYYISRSGLRLGTTGRVDSNTRTCLTAPATTGFEQLKQMWKITYLSKGYYSIRPMYKLDMGLHSSSTYADIVPISTNDTLNNVGLANCWGIEYANGGYVFKYVNSSSMALYPISTYTGASVITSTYSSTGSGFHWSLQKVSTVNNQVILIDTNTGSVLTNAVRYVSTGTTSTLADYNLAVSFVSAQSNDQAITWASSHPSIVSINSQTGAVTGLQSGHRSIIYAHKTHYGTTYSASYIVAIPSTMLYAVSNSGHDHLSSLEYVQSELHSMGFMNSTLRSGAMSANTCKTDLLTNNVFVSRSHGTVSQSVQGQINATGIILNNPTNSSNAVCFFSHSINNMNSVSIAVGTNDNFNQADLVMFIACQTAAGGGGDNNLPTVVVDQGAAVAIGFTENIGCVAANRWTTAFWDSFLNGNTVQQSVLNASRVHTDGDGLDSVIIVGDGSTTIKDLAS